MQKRGARSAPVIILGAIVLLVVFVFALISTISKVSGPDKGELVVGTNTPFPPFEDRKGDHVVGFDIDIAERIAKALGRKLIVKDFGEFDALFPNLETGNLDMVISSVTIRQDRDEVLDFSDSYFDASQAVLAKRQVNVVYSGDPKSLEGLRVGYQKGTTSQFWVEEHLLEKVAGMKLISFGDVALGLQLLELDSVDVIIVDSPAAKGFAKANPNLVVAGIIETGEQYGVVVSQGDRQYLLPTVNRVLRELKETGEYDALVIKWFGGKGQ